MSHAKLPALLLVFGALACSEETTTEQSRLGLDCVQGGDDVCAGGFCFSLDDQTAYCTRVCAAAADCPPEYSCLATPKLGKVCLLRRAGGACEGDGDCPSGHKCDVEAHRCYIPVLRTLCAPCTSDKQCPAGGGCQRVASTEEQFCTVSCAVDPCPEGYDCTGVGRSTPQCVPRSFSCDQGKSLCAPCKGDNECGAAHDLCVTNLVSGEKFCALDCEGAPDGCPAGFNCQDLSGQGGGPWQCVPNSGTCVGYCDEPDEARAERQCGLGRVCDTEAHECQGALDGRLCAPCQDDDGCGATPGAHCVSNHQTGETFCGQDCQKVAAAPCPSDGCTEDQTKCPMGFTCLGVGTRSGPPYQCVPDRGTCLSGTGRLGDDCTPRGAEDCLTGQCLSLGPAKVCTQSCRTASECGAGYLCCASSPALDCSREPVEGEQGVCVPAGGQFGADCSPGRAPCLSGLCLDMGTARVCTSPCAGGAGCIPGFHCEEAIAGDGTPVPVCFPDGGGGIGADCSFGPAACQGRLCLKKDSGNLCSTRCASNEECPENWACTAATTVEDQSIQACVPSGLLP